MQNPEKFELGANITIGMSAYGNYQTTQQALTALFASVHGDYELILVDDCSPDNTGQLFRDVQSSRPNTHMFSFDRNVEYSGSLNAILSHARGDYIIFLSNDIFVTPSYIRELLAAARRDERHGIVRGCSNFVDNSLPTHNITLPAGMDNWDKLAAFAAEIGQQQAGNDLYDEYLIGDAFLVSRAVIDRIGTFNPLFYGYFADLDYGVRARIAGFKLTLARGAFALHKRAANFEYLPDDLREQKLRSRWSKVHENWARFKIVYGLPVEEPYKSTNSIDWSLLSSPTFDARAHRMAAVDYSRYRIVAAQAAGEIKPILAPARR